MPVVLDGRSLSIGDVVAVARDGTAVALSPAVRDSVEASRRVVEQAVARGDTIYGVTTGFGKLAHVRIPLDRIRDLQRNLIRSHASGVGEPLAQDAVRAMMLLRANVLVHELGYFLGQQMHEAYRAGILSRAEILDLFRTPFRETGSALKCYLDLARQIAPVLRGGLAPAGGG